MTPVTHGMIGWLIAAPLKSRRDRIFVTAASLLSDLDGLGLLVSIEFYGKYHHTFSHSIFFGLLLVIGYWFFALEKWKSALCILLSFHSHILGDLLGSGIGWGIPYFWPLHKEKFEFSPPFQWELDSWQNLVITIAVLLIIMFIARVRKRTPIEIIHLETDKKVVEVLNRWTEKVKKLF